MDFNLFTQLFARIDAATATFATDVSGRIISGLMPVISLGLTMSFIVYFLLVAGNVVGHSFTGFLARVGKISLIVSIAGAGGMYQTQIADAIQHVPDEFAQTLLPNQPAGTTAANLIDKAAGEGFSKAGDAFEKVGIFEKQAIAYAAFGILMTLATAILTLVGGGFVIIAKLMLAILAALGPLFIFALLFKPTAGLFERWVSQIIGFTMQIIMISILFGLTMQIFTTYMTNVSFDGPLNFAGTLGGAVIISGVFVLLLIKIADYAVNLGGGISAGLFHEARTAAGMASNAAGVAKAANPGAAAIGASGAAMSAGRSAGAVAGRAGAAVGRAVGRFRGSRAA